MALTTLADVKTFLRIPSSNTSEDALLNMLIGDAGAVISSYCRDRKFEQQVYTDFRSGDGSRIVLLKSFPVQAVLNVWLDDNGYWGEGVNADGSTPFNSTTLQDPSTYALVLDAPLTGSAPSAWSSLTSYNVGDAASLGGFNYWCVQAHTNQQPPNTTYWTPGRADLNESRCGMLARILWDWPNIADLYLPGSLASVQSQILGNIRVQYLAGYQVIPADVQYAARLTVSQMRAIAPRGAMVQSQSITDFSYALMNPNANEAPIFSDIRKLLRKYREPPGLGGDIHAIPPGNRGGWW